MMYVHQTQLTLEHITIVVIVVDTCLSREVVQKSRSKVRWYLYDYLHEACDAQSASRHMHVDALRYTTSSMCRETKSLTFSGQSMEIK
jgi:hypothetical protein